MNLNKIIEDYLNRNPFIKNEEHLIEFKENFPIKNEDELKRFLSKRLYDAINENAPYELEHILGLYFIFDVNYLQEHVELINSLLLHDWHFKHEDLARALQRIKSITSIDTLYEAIFHHFDYLDFDDNYSFQVKCIWALGDIAKHHPESNASKKLELLCNSDNDIVRNTAVNQLLRAKACE